MSGFTDNMIEDGFTDAQEYMDHIVDKASEDVWNQVPDEDYYCENEDYYDEN